MGLFDRKKTSYYDSKPLYTLGNSSTLLVVGLGNVGSKYAKNRHNVGFMAVDRYKHAHEFSDWVEKSDMKCYISTGDVGSTRVILIKPTTMMNLSGEAVQKVQQFYKIQSADTLVVYDELDVDFGTIRTRTGGGSAGHNGIKSLKKHSKEDFGRIRIGIGPKPSLRTDSAHSDLSDKRSASLSSGGVSSDMPSSEKKGSASHQSKSEKRRTARKQGKPTQIDSADFVLQNFAKEQAERLPKILKETAALIDERTVAPLQDTSITI